MTNKHSNNASNDDVHRVAFGVREKILYKPRNILRPNDETLSETDPMEIVITLESFFQNQFQMIWSLMLVLNICIYLLV